MKHVRFFFLTMFLTFLWNLTANGQNGMCQFYFIDTIPSNMCQVFRNYNNDFYYVKYEKEPDTYHLLGIDFLMKLEMLDFGFFYKRFGLKDFSCEFPKDSKNRKGFQKVEFKNSPRIFIRALINGAYYNKVTVWMDDPCNYPFKDNKAFYLIYLPVWEE
jgi:hypothetical protein